MLTAQEADLTAAGAVETVRKAPRRSRDTEGYSQLQKTERRAGNGRCEESAPAAAFANKQCGGGQLVVASP